MKLTILTAQDKLTEIRRLYFATTRQSIGDDFARAVQLLKSMETEEERERATVYMEGLAQMQKDWARQGGASRGHKAGGAGKAGGAERSGGSGGSGRTGKAGKAGGARSRR